MIGHAWVPRPSELDATRELEVCSRCDAENEPRRPATGYEPRHLRARS
jgi:hypothetical protein